MQFGLSLPNSATPDARSLLDLIVRAEVAGWDGVFLEDYIVYQNRHEVPAYDPWSVSVQAHPGRQLEGHDTG